MVPRGQTSCLQRRPIWTSDRRSAECASHLSWPAASTGGSIFAAPRLLIRIRDNGMLLDRESDEGSYPPEGLAEALDVAEAALGRA